MSKAEAPKVIIYGEEPEGFRGTGLRGRYMRRNYDFAAKLAPHTKTPARWVLDEEPCMVCGTLLDVNEGRCIAHGKAVNQ
jgi:hypothetical protein